MNERDNGGPAFPCDVFDPHVKGPEQWEGLSLRDYFAAKALAALIAEPVEGVTQPLGPDCAIEFAHDAYAFADAMLKARKQ